MTGAETDEALMALVARRDQRALRVLMERHMGRVIALAERIVGSNVEADDIGQEAFVRVWTKAATFNPAASRFTTWTYRIVVNLAIDHRRRPSRPTGTVQDAEDVASDAPSPLASLLASEEEYAVDVAINALPERQKAAVALFHMEGLSGREAAQIMNLSEKAFESLLMRARRALKQHVEAASG